MSGYEVAAIYLAIATVAAAAYVVHDMNRRVAQARRMANAERQRRQATEVWACRRIERLEQRVAVLECKASASRAREVLIQDYTDAIIEWLES